MGGLLICSEATIMLTRTIARRSVGANDGGQRFAGAWGGGSCSETTAQLTCSLGAHRFTM